MGNMCGGRRENGQSILWSITKVPSFQGAGTETAFTGAKAAISAIKGKSIFGIYHSNDGTKFFVAWDSQAAMNSGVGPMVQALDGSGKFTETDWNDATTVSKGKLWSSPSEVAHKQVQPGAAPQASVMGISTYSLQASPFIDTFIKGMDIKHPNIAAIPGKSYWGYYYTDTQKPEGFVFWDDQVKKDEGKTPLWDIMMATQPNANGHTDHSIHTMAHGGMFTQDSDRSYHQAMIAVTSEQ